MTWVAQGFESDLCQGTIIPYMDHGSHLIEDGLIQ